MSKHFFTLALLCALPAFLKAQNTPVFSGQPVEIPDNDQLNKTFLAYHVFDLSAESLRMHLQEESNGEKTFDLQLPGVSTWSLALVSSGILPETYRLRVDDGQKITELPGPGDIAWKGRVVGSSQSDVRLTVADGFIFGSIQVGASIWFVEPLSDLLPGTVADRYIVYRTSDVLLNPDLKCGVTEVEEKKDKHLGATEHAENQVGLCKNVDLAIASAHDMFVRYSSVSGVETHNIGVMNGVGTDYDDAFSDEIYFLIATQYVSTTTTSSLDVALTASTDANTLLNNFTTWGNAGNFGVTYDDAQLWTARNICTVASGCGVIGLAWIGTVCGTSRYHILEDWNGFNAGGTGWELRVMTSHEMGHNFGLTHDGAGTTIMAPSVGNTTTWSAQSETQMTSFLGLSTTNCLATCGLNFQATAYSTTEGVSSTYLSAGEPSCEMGYTELTIPVAYSGSTAGGSVNVTVTGGSATEDLDFDIPNSTITVPSGSTNQTINFVVRIWNDAISEGNETISLQLTGTLAGSQNTTTVTIASDDLDPATSYYRYAQIGNGNSGLPVPFAGSVTDVRSQIVFSAAELTTAGFASGDIINGCALEVAIKGSTQPFSGFTIKMKHTTAGTNSTAQPENSGFTTVFSGSHTTFVGWNKFDFSPGFAWDGTSNVKIECCFDNSSSSSGDDLLRGTDTPTSVYVAANSGSGCTLPTGSWSWFTARPNTRLYKGTDIAITLNDEADTNLKAGQTAYFKDEQNEFIVTVKQTSGTDIGCINVKIDRAGTGHQSAAWLPGFLISKKTFLVTASNPSATYDITLYFSKAEITPWSNPSSLNILKSSGPIADATAGNSSINTTITRATFGPAATPDAYYSYKGTFTGFSGFALTNATTVAPVEWLYFSGKWAEKAAVLTWATAAERDNRGFDVERSVDGVSFEKIGFVPGRGTISVPQPYYFDDEKALRTGADVLYYRLRQLDSDGTHAYSNTVPVALPNSRLTYLLYPNPAHSTATLQVLGCDECSAILTLTDAAGRVVMRSETTGTTTPIDLSGLPSGMYLAEILAQDGGRWQSKLVKL